MAMDCFFKYSKDIESLVDIFEEITLIDKKNNKIPASDILRNVKYLVLIFIGYENLQEKYEILTNKLIMILKRANELNLRLEIIYVPIDTEESFFLDHLREHRNWYHLGVKDAYRRLLIEKYQIIVNPSIIVLSKDGEIISKDGVQDILQDDINVLVTWT